MRIYPENSPPPGSQPRDWSAEIPPTPLRRVVEFHRLLLELTPRTYVTPVLIGANVILFVLMVVSGVNLLRPTGADLVLWGADFGPKTLGGEWWRLVTSMFIHGGLVHLGMNMWALYAVGPFVERMVGNVGFLLMYLLAGLCGGLASLIWNPIVPSVGASGAIFGVIGCLLGLVVRGRGSIPTETLAQLKSSGLGFVVVNVVLGMTIPNIDMAAHLGGLAGGFLGGLVLSQPFTTTTPFSRLLRNLLLAVLGTGFVTGGFMGIAAWKSEIVKAGQDFEASLKIEQELEAFGKVEKKAFDTFDAAEKHLQRKELSEEAFAGVLERDVLPKWRAARERLAALQPVPPKHQRRVELILDYMRLRQEAWELMARAAQAKNEEQMARALRIQEQAEAVARQVGSESSE
jgi:rhomboid protease GluP